MVGSFRTSKLQVHDTILANLTGTFQSFVVEMFPQLHFKERLRLSNAK